MNLTDTFGTQFAKFLADVAMMIGSILEIVVDLDLFASYFLQQFLIKLSSHTRSDADGYSCLFRHLSGCAKTGYQSKVFLTALFLPSLSTSAQGQKSYFASKEFHRLEAISQKILIIFTGQKALSEETAHRHRRNCYPILECGCLEFLCLFRVTELVVEQYAFTQSTHINLYAISFQFVSQLKLTKLLTFQHHPVASGNLISSGYRLRTY